MSNEETNTPKKSWFSRVKDSLKKSSDQISTGLKDIFTKRKLDDELLEELEDLLIASDLGLEATGKIIEQLKKTRFGKEVEVDEVKSFIAEQVSEMLSPYAQALEVSDQQKPFIILVAGVNGVGKTTTIGKLAQMFSLEGKKCMFAACDTFRAAATEQLNVWAERTSSKLISRPAGADASGLAFDAVKQAQEEGVDILFIDTAGRLHNKTELMASLEKMNRVIQKVMPDAPHKSLLVLDATTGQNALQQVKIFQEMVAINGLVVTKLDGTARGGILVALSEKFNLPIHAIGIGEKADDLRPFEASAFAQHLVGLDEARLN